MKEQVNNRFHGLPFAQRILINELLNRVHLTNGCIQDVSYNELAKVLTIKPAPGRTNTGIPTKQTIRNWIKSIERECGEYFQVITEGQRLKFLFPEVPVVFNRLFDNIDVNLEDVASEVPVKIENNRVLSKEVNIQLNTEVNTPEQHVKNNIININNNKQTNTTAGVSSSKKCIADDFYPDEQTIDLAKTLGFTNAEEPEEIKAFIYHNKINQTQWADFNPIYIRWLERKAEYQLKQQNRTQGLLRSTNNERRFYQKPGQQSELHAVSVTHGISCESIWESGEHSESESFIDSGRLIQIVDEAHSNIWSDFR